jgi:hypothetical protein
MFEEVCGGIALAAIDASVAVVWTEVRVINVE